MLTWTCLYIENCISYNNNDSIKNVNKRLILSAIKIIYMFGAQVILILKYKVSNCPYIKQNLSHN